MPLCIGDSGPSYVVDLKKWHAEHVRHWASQVKMEESLQKALHAANVKGADLLKGIAHVYSLVRESRRAAATKHISGLMARCLGPNLAGTVCAV